MKKISICCTVIIINFICNAQSFNLNFDEDEITTQNDVSVFNKSEAVKNNFHIGLEVGLHSGSLDNTTLNFDQDVYYEIYTKFNLSNEVFFLVSLNYWNAQIEKKNLTSTDLIESKALRVEVDFSLFKIYKASFLLGPSISIGDNTESTNAVCSF
ncbi:MAG: hypothetical protein RBR74_07465, partial [Ignavibacteriaceae bacterium]|nr:hypothetical protein [Ignavibacteriaceae bacterium]